MRGAIDTRLPTLGSDALFEVAPEVVVVVVAAAAGATEEVAAGTTTTVDCYC